MLSPPYEAQYDAVPGMHERTGPDIFGVIGRSMSAPITTPSELEWVVYVGNAAPVEGMDEI